MRRPATLTAALTLATVTAFTAGCGNGSSSASGSPRAELLAGFDALAKSSATTVTIGLSTDAASLRAFAAAQHTKLSANAASAVATARLVIQSLKQHGHTDTALTGSVGGQPVIELRSVDQTLYLRGAVRQLLALAGKSKSYAELRTRVASMPPFVRAAVAGHWVSLNAGALGGFGGSLGGGAGGNTSERSATINDFKALLTKDVTITRIGHDSAGDHLALTADAHQLALDVEAALRKNLPGGSMFGDKLKAADVPHRQVRVDAWVAGGALSKLTVDLAQVARSRVGATPVPLTVTFATSSGDIVAPSGATPVDLTQLGALIGAGFGGMQS